MALDNPKKRSTITFLIHFNGFLLFMAAEVEKKGKLKPVPGDVAAEFLIKSLDIDSIFKSNNPSESWYEAYKPFIKFEQDHGYNPPSSMRPEGSIHTAVRDYLKGLQDARDSARWDRTDYLVGKMVEETVLPGDMRNSAELARLVLGAFIAAEVREKIGPEISGDNSVVSFGILTEGIPQDVQNIISSREEQMGSTYSEPGLGLLGHLVVKGFSPIRPESPLNPVVTGVKGLVGALRR